jgi:hypothetical protein
MCRFGLPDSMASLTLLSGVLCACRSAHYQNATHPNYGDTEYRVDLAQCRRENSTVVITQGYDQQIDVKIDEPKVSACLAAHGWQPTSR